MLIVVNKDSRKALTDAVGCWRSVNSVDPIEIMKQKDHVTSLKHEEQYILWLIS